MSAFLKDFELMTEAPSTKNPVPQRYQVAKREDWLWAMGFFLSRRFAAIVRAPIVAGPCHLEKRPAFVLQIPLSDKIRYAATNEDTML